MWSAGLSPPIVVFLMAAAACSSGEPGPSIVPASAPPTILAGRKLEQFAAAVSELRAQVALTRATDAVDAAGIRIALRHLADAVQLLPRGASVLATIEPANAIRSSAIRVGSPVMDDPSRTAAVQRALQIAASTLRLVATEAYQDAPELAPETADLVGVVNSIDRLRLLDHERPKILEAFDRSVAVLEGMERAEHAL